MNDEVAAAATAARRRSLRSPHPLPRRSRILVARRSCSPNSKTGRRRMEEDKRRESALAKTAILQPNSNPPGVSKSQLDKFKELHRRRLQIKSNFKDKNKHKGPARVLTGNKKFEGKDIKAKDCVDEVADLVTEGSSVTESNVTKVSSPQDDVPLVFRKRKLHWGLDTKERWERKSNM